MFMPPNNNVVPPVTTPIFGDIAGATITDYLANFRATDLNTIATMGAIVFVLATHAAVGGAAPPDLTFNCRKAFRGDSFTGILAAMAAPAAAPVSDNEHNIAAIRLNVPAVPNWMIDWITAAKKKPITEDNIAGYLAALGHTGTKCAPVARLVNQLAAFFPDGISNPDVRALQMPGVWTNYRNTRVSSGIILRNLLPNFRDLRITSLNNADEQLIVASAAAPWDTNLSLLILPKFRAYGCIFLRAAGTPIDNWHQGNKAVDELAATRVRAIKDVFVRYLELKNVVPGLAAATDVASLSTDAMQAFFA
jgi:hypothetical protein